MTSTIDLAPEHLAEFRAILARYIPQREVWGFGSRAKGTAKAMSDIDLCVMGEEQLTPEEYQLLMTAFQDSLLPVSVDVVEWARVTPEFRRVIEAHHAVVAGDIEVA